MLVPAAARVAAPGAHGAHGSAAHRRQCTRARDLTARAASRHCDCRLCRSNTKSPWKCQRTKPRRPRSDARARFLAFLRSIDRTTTMITFKMISLDGIRAVLAEYSRLIDPNCLHLGVLRINQSRAFIDFNTTVCTSNWQSRVLPPAANSLRAAGTSTADTARCALIDLV